MGDSSDHDVLYSARHFDARPSKTAMAGWMATAISIFSIIIAWIAYDLIWRSPLKTKPWAAVTLLTVSLFTYAYWIDGFFNGRFVLLQIGAMIATTMSANVRFVIIPNQKKLWRFIRGQTA